MVCTCGEVEENTEVPETACDAPFCSLTAPPTT